MPHYDFTDCKTGETTTLFYRSAEVPSINSIVRRNGRRLKRVLSLPQAGVADKPRARRNVPKWLPGAIAYDHRGYPVISNAEGRRLGLVENPHLDTH